MKALTFLSLLLFPILLVSQEQYQLTGNIAEDSKIIGTQTLPEVYTFEETTAPSKKSPLLAGILSALVPGAGQVYNGDYWKAAGFVAIEAAAIAGVIMYNKKGDDKTVEFQNYADQNWSVVKYSEWINKYKAELGIPDSLGITINGNTDLKPWQRVNFEQVNIAETAADSFSHRIYPHGHQQYYEMIGKYKQYHQGWADQNLQSPLIEIDVSPMFTLYSQMRGDANDYYNVADKILLVVYVNHLLSALDAVLSAVSFNKELAFNVRLTPLRKENSVEMMPTVSLGMRF